MPVYVCICMYMYVYVCVCMSVCMCYTNALLETGGMESCMLYGAMDPAARKVDH